MEIKSEILCYVLNEETFPDKTVMIKEGSVTSWIYVILDGKAKIIKKTSKGDITLNTLAVGDFIGETGLLKKGRQPQVYSVVADGEITVGTLDITNLTKEWNTQPEKLQELISNLMQKMDNMIERLVTQVEASKE